MRRLQCSHLPPFAVVGVFLVAFAVVFVGGGVTVVFNVIIVVVVSVDTAVVVGSDVNTVAETASGITSKANMVRNIEFASI